MMPVYFAHPQVLTDASMLRLAAFPIHGPLRHYAAFRVALTYFLAELISEALEMGEDVAPLLEQRLNVPTPEFSYDGIDAREVCRLLALPRENSQLGSEERRRLQRALNTYSFALTDAVLESSASQAFLSDIATNYAGVAQTELERHFAETNQAVQGLGERQADRTQAEILQAQALAAEHRADLTLDKYLESLISYADR